MSTLVSSRSPEAVRLIARRAQRGQSDLATFRGYSRAVDRIGMAVALATFLVMIAAFLITALSLGPIKGPASAAQACLVLFVPATAIAPFFTRRLAMRLSHSWELAKLERLQEGGYFFEVSWEIERTWKKLLERAGVLLKSEYANMARYYDVFYCLRCYDLIFESFSWDDEEYIEAQRQVAAALKPCAREAATRFAEHQAIEQARHQALESADRELARRLLS